MMHLNLPILATFGLLTLALASLGLTGRGRFSVQMRWIWPLPLMAATGLGIYYGFLQPKALLAISAFGLACWASTRADANLYVKSLSGSIVLALAVALFLHKLPGFSNPKIIVNLKLTPDATLYNKYLNFDSALIGLGILGFGQRRLSSLAEWSSMLKTTAPIMLGTLLTVMLLSLLLGYVQWHPKWTPLFFVWAWGNLFFTCIAEEAFFRAFIQKNLMIYLSNYPGGTAFALLITSLSFGLAHSSGGFNYVILATVAGIGYGLAYHKTQAIEASILTHFTLNSLHFLLFTYPVLASALS